MSIPKGGTNGEDITRKQFLDDLGKLKQPETVVFAGWVLDEVSSPRHDLAVKWGRGGPLIQYEDPDAGPFTFGQLTRDGKLGHTQRIWGRCKRLGLSLDIPRDYLDAVASLIPGARRKRFKTEKLDIEQVVMGDRARDWPPLRLLAPRKEKWFAAIDATVARIRETLGGA